MSCYVVFASLKKFKPRRCLINAFKWKTSTHHRWTENCRYYHDQIAFKMAPMFTDIWRWSKKSQMGLNESRQDVNHKQLILRCLILALICVCVSVFVCVCVCVCICVCVCVCVCVCADEFVHVLIFLSLVDAWRIFDCTVNSPKMHSILSPPFPFSVFSFSTVRPLYLFLSLPYFLLFT